MLLTSVTLIHLILKKERKGYSGTGLTGTSVFKIHNYYLIKIS